MLSPKCGIGIRILTLWTLLLLVNGFAPLTRYHNNNFVSFHHSFITTRIRRKKTSHRSDTLTTTTTTNLGGLVESTDTWGNIAALTGAATVAQSLGKTTKLGRLLGPPVTAMFLTFTLASIGILHPGGTAASKFLQLLTLQLATPLVLLGADLRHCVERQQHILNALVVHVRVVIVQVGHERPGDIDRHEA